MTPEASAPEAASPPVPASESAPARPPRLVSIDAYRGLVMFLLLAERLNIDRVAKALPDSAFWRFLHAQQTHVAWTGAVLHDMIQPSFSFLVGVALPFSVAGRRARGDSAGVAQGHAVWRALVLVLLGIVLRSIGQPRTYFTFEDTLTQIGLGYGFLYLIALRPVREQWMALGAILFGYWLLFALWPAPAAPQFLTGFAAHWDKNTNPAWAFDTWFLNLFPREKPFTANSGGYATLSFIPTLGTMILGLLAGEILRSPSTNAEKLRWMLTAGAIALVSGWLFGAFGICPVVKRIWTPSWVLFSGGWCLLALAAFYALIDVRGWRRWAFFFVVLGMNSIAAYVMEWLWPKFLGDAVSRHLGPGVLEIFGAACAPLLQGICVVGILWLILFWMWKRKILLKI